MNIQVRRVLSSEWNLYKTLRLSALKGAPEAFGSTYEQSILRSDESWQQQVTKLADTELAVNFLAFDGDDPVGMVSCYISDKAKMVQMWVEPLVRGKGVGQQLVEKLFSWLRNKKQSELHAVVYEDNIHALKLYLRLGFIELNTYDKETHLCYKII